MATILARDGYATVQNPSPNEVAQARRRTGDHGRLGTKPDYIIEGRVFDCYAPTTPRVRNVWDTARDKVVRKQQTQRVVIDLRHWDGDAQALLRQFAEYPIPGLKELKLITRTGLITDVPVRRD